MVRPPQIRTSYWSNIGEKENIGIGGRYVGANIKVSAKISVGRIYRYGLTCTLCLLAWRIQKPLTKNDEPFKVSSYGRT